VNINVHIERLLLDAVDVQYGQRHLLTAALETELARLLSEGALAPMLSSGGALVRINAPSIQINHGIGAADIGRQIAGSIYGGIGK
jgi:hypothetical protein